MSIIFCAVLFYSSSFKKKDVLGKITGRPLMFGIKGFSSSYSFSFSSFFPFLDKCFCQFLR